MPAPIIFPATTFCVHEPTTSLKILYLGHGSYLRFPYDKVLNALAKLRREGYAVKFVAYISKLGYADYQQFGKSFCNSLNCTDRNIVELHIANLSEPEKYNAICDSDVLLYPALVDAAIDPPLVILEAMSLGKCVIATSLRSIPHLLSNNAGV